MTCNIRATQRLLEATRQASTVQRLIYSSTSSIYGSIVTGPETTLPQPVSPYGITKLAAEHLVATYDRQFGIPATILRYFSVYGPRQRPDMGYYLFIDHLLRDEPITVWGDGTQLRANLLACKRFRRGGVYNIGGGEEISALGIIDLLWQITGKRGQIDFGPARPGEQQRAVADATLAHEALGFVPMTPLREGLSAQVAWQYAMMHA